VGLQNQGCREGETRKGESLVPKVVSGEGGRRVKKRGGRKVRDTK